MDGAQYAGACLHYKLYFNALCACCPQVSSRSQLSATDLIADKPLHKSKTAIGSTVAPTSASELPTACVLLNLHQDLIVSLRQLWHTSSLTVAPRSQHDIDSGSLTSLRALVEALYEI